MTSTKKHVFREVSLTLGEETYTFTPSNKLMRRIDAGLHPQTVYGVIGLLKEQEVPVPAISYILAEMIHEAGGDVDEDEVHAALFQDMAQNDGAKMMELVNVIAECITPVGALQNPQKPPATTKTKKAKKAPARR